MIVTELKRRILRVGILLVAATGLLGPPVAAQAITGIAGRVTDAATRAPISGANVRLRQLGRSELSHADGTFHFDRLAPGVYTVAVERIGYAPAEERVRVADGATAEVTLALSPSAIEVGTIVVTATGSERSASETYRPTTVLSDAELRRKLGTSVAATLAGEPGISQRYNGPAAAQPVIRGLGGDRVLVLEDGQRTGDISTTSGDHAVAIDPLTAERIEVVRGPAALMYGSNALGGVINVVREEVPRTLPERLSGTVSSQAESVNRGLTAGAAATLPVGPFAVRAELSGRRAGDTRTPRGILPTTELIGLNGAIGASWVGSQGFAGAALRDYWMRYGVPGTFNGQTIPGGHEGGVEIEQRRTAGRVEAARFSGAGPFDSIELDGGYVRLDQREFELGGPGGPVIGTRFRQFTGSGNLIARHHHESGATLAQGAVGVWGMGRDFSTAGLRTGSRPARQYSLAGFAFEELAWNPFRLEVGARYDWSRIDPLDKRPRGGQEVRTRDFGAFSGSLAALVQPWSGWSIGTSVSRAFRTPSIEELFSDGPHLANYSFDVGNPDLTPEYGLGTELFVRAALPRLHGEVSVFRNSIRDYIRYAPTGELDPRFGQFPIYRAAQDDAVLSGAEGRVQWEVASRWVLDGNASYVRGSRDGDAGREALPAIPPLHGSLGVRHDATRFFAGASAEAAAAQNRVPPAPEGGAGLAGFERPTPRYTLLHATGGLRWTAVGRLQTLTLTANNLLDTAWTDHLSRIKAVAPQPGRNLQLLYRVAF